MEQLQTYDQIVLLVETMPILFCEHYALLVLGQHLSTIGASGIYIQERSLPVTLKHQEG